MRIIKQVEISKFRSFGDLEIMESYDFNILSGSNDSGKSNLLKALNLFFNGETDIDSRYNPENDFNKWFRDNNERGQRIISIKVYITKGNYLDKSGINNGFIAEKIFRIDGGYDTYFYNNDGSEIHQNEFSHRKANAVINEKIRYIYIPTVRDLKFRENVQRLIQEIANSTDNRFKTQDLKNGFQTLEKALDKQLEQLSLYVKEKMNLQIETTVNFGTLLESLTFETSDKIKIKKKGKSDLETQKVSLRSRGEGIQMQFFSFMLWFISKTDKKHFYVWGYEEPEIAFEFKRQFELAEVFENTFSRAAQIFVTTHSPAFAFYEANSKTKIFRVNYDQDKSTKKQRLISKIVSLNEYYEGLFKDLNNSNLENRTALERDIWGINAQKISRMIGQSMEEIIGLREISNQQIDELKNILIAQKTNYIQLQEKVINIEEELTNLFPQKIFICEDQNGVALWENLLFDKLSLERTSFKIIPSKGCSVDNVEIAIQHLKKTKPSYNPKIFRQLDRDGFTKEQIECLEDLKTKKFKTLKYKLKFLPVNELENFAVLADPYFTIELVQKFENFNKLSTEFNGTINANIFSAMKLCDDEKKKLFNSQQKKMVEEANSNLLKYYPGKEIKKLKTGFNAEKALIKMTFDEYDIELKEFLTEIQEFYAS